MNNLKKYEEMINKCSRCGLCQSVCPIYLLTKNDCTSPKGKCILINNIIHKKNHPTKKIKMYIDLCTNCEKCKDFCPSKINIPEIKKAFFKDFPSINFNFILKIIYILKIFFYKISNNKNLKKEYEMIKNLSKKNNIGYINTYSSKDIPAIIKNLTPKFYENPINANSFIYKNRVFSKKLFKNLLAEILQDNCQYIITNSIYCKFEMEKLTKNDSVKILYMKVEEENIYKF